MGLAKADAKPRKIVLKAIKMTPKSTNEVQVHLRLQPDSATILLLLSRRYGYNGQGEYLDDLLPLVFEQEYGFPFAKVAAPKDEQLKQIDAKAKK